MFLLKLYLLDGSGGSLCELRGFVASVSDSLVSDFHVGVQSAGQENFLHGLLSRSPRYAEPVLGFVGRALSSLDFAGSTWELPPHHGLTMSVVDARRSMKQVAKLCVPLQRSELAEASLGPWDLVRRWCVQDVYGCERAPESPAPLDLPVRWHGEVRYCLLEELPADARLAARWVIPKDAKVLVPGHKDAVSPETAFAFLSNQLEVPRPFGGWLWP